jgi:large subunit ribosomal protein L6
MDKKQIFKILEIPKDIGLDIKDSEITIKHAGREITKKFKLEGIAIVKNNDLIEVKSNKANRMKAKMIGSIIAHIKNMIKGVKEDFVYRLEICNVHFPMTVKIEGDNLIIKNFLGETIDRKANIVKNTKVSVKGNEILVSSFDREAAGQTAANIEMATKIRFKDRRVFQDGIFLTERCGRKI